MTGEPGDQRHLAPGSPGGPRGTDLRGQALLVQTTDLPGEGRALALQAAQQRRHLITCSRGAKDGLLIRDGHAGDSKTPTFGKLRRRRRQCQKKWLLFHAFEEAEDALGELRGGWFVVGGQAAVGEQMPVAGVKEEFGVPRRLDSRRGAASISPSPAKVVIFHAVNLDGNSRGPGTAELRERYACFEQRGTLGAWAGLGQHLCGQDAKGESGVDQFCGQLLGCRPAALDDRAEPGSWPRIPRLLAGWRRPARRTGRGRGRCGQRPGAGPRSR